MIRRLLCLLLLALALPWQVFAATTPLRQTLPSAILGETRSYQVLLPDSYRWAQSRHYPVLYLLDAQNNAGHSFGTIPFLAQQGDIPEMIVVAIDSTVRVRDFTQTDWPEAWIGGGGAEKFADFLQRELIPRIEHDYRANDFRILSGHSASAQFGLHMLGTRPALFNAVIAIAPSLDWDHGLPARELESELAKPGRPPRFVYFAYADDFESALAADLELDRVIKAPGEATLRHVTRAFPNEHHTGVSLLAQIDALRSLYTGYALPETAQPPTVAAVEAHYRELGECLGTKIAVPESALNDLGYRALERGDHAQAIELLDRAAKENPESSNAWDSLADAYAGASEWQKAVDAELKAAELGKRYDTGDAAHFQHQIAKYRAKLSAP